MNRNSASGAPSAGVSDAGRISLTAFLLMAIILPAAGRAQLAPLPPPNPPVTPKPSMSQLVRKLILAADSPVLHYELGMTYLRQGLYPQAEKECFTALEMVRKNRKFATLETDLAKGYLRTVKARRSLASEMKLIQDIYRSNPRDAEVGRWMVDVYLDKGDVNMARTLLATNPSLKENADLLAKWIGADKAAPAGLDAQRDLARQRERFNDLAMLMAVGSETLKMDAAAELLELAGQIPLTTVSARERETAEKAFETLRTAAARTALKPDQVLKFYQEYLALLEHWKFYPKARTLIQEMLRRFETARNEPTLFYFLAKIQNAQGLHTESLVSIREAFRLGLENGPARMMHADLLEKKGKSLEALNEYVTALESLLPEPDRQLAATRIEKYLAPASIHVDEKLIERMAAEMPGSHRAQVLWAEILETRGKWEDAYDRFLDAAKLEGAGRDAKEGLARMAIRLGRASDVGMALQRLDAGQLRKLWDHSQTLQIGRRLMALGETAVVREMARKMETGGFATPDQISLAAELAVAENRMTGANALYAQLKQRRTLTDLELQKWRTAQTAEERKRAESLFALDRYAEALAVYNAAADSSAPHLLLRRAACLAKLARPKEAIDLLERERMGLEYQIQRAALLVSLYDQTGNPGKAELVYKGLMQSDSRHLPIESARKLAGLLASKQRWADALPILDRIAEHPEMSTTDRMAWVGGKIRTKNFAEVDRMEQMLRDLVRDTTDAYALLGRYEEAMGNRGAAQAAYQIAIRGNSGNEQAAIRLAKMWAETADDRQAIDLLSALDPKSKDVCRLLSELHAKNGRWELAAAWMEKGIDADRDKMMAAWYWFRAGQIDEAARFVPKGGLFEAVLEAEAGRPRNLKKRNASLLRTVLGESDEGTEKEKIQNGWIESDLETARRRQDAGDDESLLALCDGIIKRTDNAQALYLKGSTLLKLGFYGDAKNALEQAARSADWSVPANLKLGQLAIIQDDPLAALRHLDKAGPGSDPAEVIMAWGMALALSKSPEQGEDILRQVARKSARGKFFLARLLEQQGRAKEALEIYKSAVKDDPGFIPAQYRLGTMALSAGDHATAELSFSDILQNPKAASPYIEEANEKLRRIRKTGP